MKRSPKIVGERVRKAREMEPPHDFILHDWGKPYMGIEVYISERAVEKILRHCAAYAKRRLEAMGYLIGDVCKWKGKEYTLIEDVVTSELDTTSVSVRFSREAFEKLFEELDKIDYDYILVGWYHSHPGHQCFMSMTDINTQKRMFNKPFHVAIVVDPINEEMRAYKLVGNRAEEKVFAIYKENSSVPHKDYRIMVEETKASGQPPSPTKVKKVRKRKVKKLASSLPTKEEPSIHILYLLPIFFGIVGGVTGYILALSRDKLGAWKMIAIGIIMGAIWYFIAPFIQA